MIANLKGQGPGAVHAVPRPGSGPSSARGASAALAASPSPNAPSPNENAVFDANGDGTIENWGFLHGGDSYTSFTPPPTGADPTRGRKVEPAQAAGHAKTPAAIRHAHAAYRRDGSPVHDTSPDTARTPGPAPAPTKSTNPLPAQPPSTPALRSVG